MRTRIALSAVVGALVVVVAGCGGSDSTSTTETNPTDAWASGFCSAVTSWTDELKTISSQFSDPSNLSQDGLQSAAEDVRTATDTLAGDLKDLGAPDTQSGQEVKSSLDSLSSTLEDESSQITDTVEGVSGITGILSAATSITASLKAMGTAFQETLQTIQNADAGNELQNALADSPECADLSS